MALGSDKGLDFVGDMALGAAVNPEMTAPLNFDDTDLIPREFLDRREMAAVSTCREGKDIACSVDCENSLYRGGMFMEAFFADDTF
jgi:hypothetical protein